MRLECMQLAEGTTASELNGDGRMSRCGPRMKACSCLDGTISDMDWFEQAES